MNAYSITSEAYGILREVIQKFPEYTPLLAQLPVRISTRMTRGLGTARFKGGKVFELVLSYNAFKHDENRAELRDTILHEIAHVIAGVRAGHGPAWRAVARRVGARPERVCTSLAVSPIKYVTIACYVCQGDLQVTPMRAAKAKRGTRRYRHTACQPKKPLDLLNTIFS